MARGSLMKPRAGHRHGGVCGSCLLPNPTAKNFFLPVVVLAAFFLSSSPVTYSMELLEDAGSCVVPTVYILVVTQESHGLLVTLPIPFLQGPLGDI